MERDRKMTKQRIKKILDIIFWAGFAFCFISFISIEIENIEVKNECKAVELEQVK